MFLARTIKFHGFQSMSIFSCINLSVEINECLLCYRIIKTDAMKTQLKNTLGTFSASGHGSFAIS